MMMYKEAKSHQSKKILTNEVTSDLKNVIAQTLLPFNRSFYPYPVSKSFRENHRQTLISNLTDIQ